MPLPAESMEALAKNERRFCALTEKVSELLTIVDATGRIIYESLNLGRLLGYAAGEWQGRSVFDLVHPDDVAAARSLFAELVKKPGETRVIELRVGARDGTWRWLETLGTNLLADPAVNGIILNSRDVTERRRLETTLRESESRYHTLFENAADAIVLFDLQTLHFLDCNDQACHRLGYTREEFAQLTLADVEAAESVEQIREHLAEIVARGGDVFETKHRAKNGAIFDIEVRANVIHLQGKPVLIAVWRDITERKRTEKALFRERELLRRILDTIPVFVVQYDPQQQQFQFNEHFRRVFGWTEADAAGGDFMAKVYPDPQYRQMVADYMASLAPGWRDIVTTAKDGTRVDCLWANVRLSDNTQIGIGIDIRERKQAERSLQYRLALERLLADISSRLVNASSAEVNTVIHNALADLGRLMQADRCYLFSVTSDLALAHNTHEWCAPGIRAQIAEFQNVPVASFPWLLKQLSDGEPLQITQTADLPSEAAEVRRLLEQGQVQSVILVPIRHGGKLTGLIGCDAVRTARCWPDEDIRLLRTVGEILIGAQVRCRAEEALRQSEERYRQMAEAVPHLAWRCDASGGTIDCNRRWYEYTGQTPEEARGNGWMRALHPDDRARVLQRVQNDVAGGEVYQTEYRLRRASDGAYRWHLARALPVRNGDGEIIGWFGSAADIEDQKRAEEELERRVRERTLELAAANEALQKEIEKRQKLERQILEISEREQRRIGQDLHDSIGQQVVGLKFVSWLLSEQLAARRSAAAPQAKRISNELEKLVEDIRKVARGLHPVRQDPEGLMMALKELADSTSSLFEISCRFVCRRPVLLHDEMAATNLYRIAQEAVNNAVRHGQPKQIEIRLEIVKDHVCLSVKDDGKGLPPVEERGTGLGLQIMQYRAAAIGAAFAIKKVSSGGTLVQCCWTTLPQTANGNHSPRPSSTNNG